MATGAAVSEATGAAVGVATGAAVGVATGAVETAPPRDEMSPMRFKMAAALCGLFNCSKKVKFCTASLASSPALMKPSTTVPCAVAKSCCAFRGSLPSTFIFMDANSSRIFPSSGFAASGMSASNARVRGTAMLYATLSARLAIPKKRIAFCAARAWSTLMNCSTMTDATPITRPANGSMPAMAVTARMPCDTACSFVDLPVSSTMPEWITTIAWKVQNSVLYSWQK
ncbi:MAG: hypothetical protein EOO41_01575 [Methanobacteriota archaeon]|nr:MAG: hypothetical protein EOO41_01575 [Euryarchaeota archaeon]